MVSMHVVTALKYRPVKNRYSFKPLYKEELHLLGMKPLSATLVDDSLALEKEMRSPML